MENSEDERSLIIRIMKVISSYDDCIQLSVPVTYLVFPFGSQLEFFYSIEYDYESMSFEEKDSSYAMSVDVDDLSIGERNRKQMRRSYNRDSWKEEQVSVIKIKNE